MVSRVETVGGKVETVECITYVPLLVSYMQPSWTFEVWKQNAVGGRLFMFFFPYFHFMNIWGCFVGYTDMPSKTFSSKELFISQDELAFASLPKPPSPNSTITMAPQGSTLVTRTGCDYFNFWFDNGTLRDYAGADFCPYFDGCAYAEDPGAQHGATSVMDSIGMLFTLSLLYMILAAYWSNVFDRRNGKGERFYFFLLPSYWFSKETKSTNEEREMGVVIQQVSKSFGRFEALKQVSFKMNPGEVTALLGHNGAGTT